MPYIVTGEPTNWSSDVYKSQNHSYKYPHGLNLKPGSELHDSLRSKIWERASESRNEISKRFDSWRKIDETLTTYITLDDYEEELKGADPNRPVSIVFPYSYSMLEALLTYLSMSAFQDPMFQYEGVEDDDTTGAMLMELIIRLHCMKNKVALNVHTAFRDSLCYGVGIGIPEWVTKYGKKLVKTSSVFESALGDITNNETMLIDSLLFEGNGLSNIDPYMWLPDPSFSSVDMQKGEFIGWVERDNYMNLLSEESKPDSELFNVKYLKSKGDKRSTLAIAEINREIRNGGP